jgi:hypothetical protein
MNINQIKFISISKNKKAINKFKKNKIKLKV